jgi:hypothetical protein
MSTYRILLPRTYAAPLTVGGVLTVGRHATVDATAGNLTFTLPTVTDVDAVISVEKVDASSSTVTVGGPLRGGGGTVILAVQYQTVEFRWNGSTWRAVSGFTP